VGSVGGGVLEGAEPVKEEIGRKGRKGGIEIKKSVEGR
jgi:hypothetical protein